MEILGEFCNSTVPNLFWGGPEEVALFLLINIMDISSANQHDQHLWTFQSDLRVATLEWINLFSVFVDVLYVCRQMIQLGPPWIFMNQPQAEPLCNHYVTFWSWYNMFRGWCLIAMQREQLCFSVYTYILFRLSVVAFVCTYIYIYILIFIV